MTRDELYAKYEDALFEVLLAEKAYAEGQEALLENERIKNDPAYDVPDEIRKRDMNLIQSHFLRQRLRAVGRVSVKVLHRVALIAGFAMMLFTVAFAASDDFRIGTLNLIIETFDYGTVFSFHDEPIQTNLQLELGWIPDGYLLSDTITNDYYIEETYRNGYSGSLKVLYVRTDGVAATIDTENAQVESLEINGMNASYIQKDVDQQLFLILPDNSAYIQITANELEKDVLMQVANEIIL